MNDEEIIRAFHAMWDKFPEPVTITQRSREIVAVNEKAAEFGLMPGIKCSSIGKQEDHKGCLCNKAIDTKEAIGVTYDGPFGRAYGYWIPVAAKPEWIIHFSVGRAVQYDELKR